MMNVDDSIYFDNNATTRPDPLVVETMTDALARYWANPSSVHRRGQEVRHQVELARESVCKLINCAMGELVFTSGGTESANLAIFGTCRRKRSGPARDVIITTPIEHSAVAEPMEALSKQGWAVVMLPVDGDGVVECAELEKALADNAGRVALVSIQWANNETGAVQAIPELVAATRAADARIVFHTDATQWVGKYATDVGAVPVDLMTFSAHKIHGPKGIGALYVRRGIRLAPSIRGGPQERTRRGGTENVMGIIGFGVASRLAKDRLTTGGEDGSGAAKRIGALRDRFEREVLQAVPIASINAVGAREGRLWNTSNIAFARLEAEAILLVLSESGLCVSAGAACSSGSLDPSPVLLAMGLAPEKAHGSIRFSLSHESTDDEVDRAVRIVSTAISRLTETLPPVDE